MSNADERLQVYIKKMEQDLEAARIENEKLQTRLRGYETVGKLATGTQNENKELKKKVDELQRTVSLLEKGQADMKLRSSMERTSSVPATGTSTDRKENDVNSLQFYTDLQTSPASNPSTNGSSASFSIIGKSSRDSHLAQPPFSFHSSPQHSRHEEFSMLPTTKETDASLLAGKEPPAKNNGISHSEGNEHVIHLPEEGRKVSRPGSLDEFIQVFPEGTPQSGGSNFSVPSFDQEFGGGPSYANSSRRGPMSMIGASMGNGSMSSYQIVDTKTRNRKEAVQDEDPGTVSFDKSPQPTNSVDPMIFSGAGARPRENSAWAKTTPEGRIRDSEIKIPSESSDEENKRLMVKIPTEDADYYRINNAPFLSYGKEDSQTEISALTSFGSSLATPSPEKEKPEPYNNLNFGVHDSRAVVEAPKLERISLTSQSVQIRNILSSKTNISHTRNIILPFLEDVDQLERKVKEIQVENERLKHLLQRFPASTETGEKEHTNNSIDHEKWIVVAQQETHDTKQRSEPTSEEKSILQKENDALRTRNNELHAANKEWKDRWDLLKKQKEDENLQLHLQVKQLAHEKERLRQEMECVIASQKEELLQANIAKREKDRAYAVLHTGKSQEKQLLEQLKQDYGTLHQEKRALEIKVDTLKTHQPEYSRPPECLKENTELETELAVVKRQVTLFMDDFNREHQERLALEDKVQKEKDTVHSLETKLKKTHSLLKSRDEDLRKKSKHASDLQFQVDDLQLKLEIEQRRPSIYPSMSSMDIPAPSATQQENLVSIPGSTAKQVTRGDNLVRRHKSDAHMIKPPTWSCNACTFQNKISHKKCEMCGSPFVGTEGRYVELDGV